MRNELVARYESIFEIYGRGLGEKMAKIEESILGRKFDEAKKLLAEFKTEDELLMELEEKLKGKPIYNTLKRIRRGTVENKAQILKGLFSLGTHAMIEVEAGRPEYLYIAKRIHEKLSEQLKRE